MAMELSIQYFICCVNICGVNQIFYEMQIFELYSQLLISSCQKLCKKLGSGGVESSSGKNELKK